MRLTFGVSTWYIILHTVESYKRKVHAHNMSICRTGSRNSGVLNFSLSYHGQNCPESIGRVILILMQ